MIDLFTVFHRGGAVLYTKQLNPVSGHPVDALISHILLEERVGQTSYRHEEKYTVKWTFANEFDLVFVAVYLNLTNLLYLDDLLAACRDRFCSMFRDAIKAVEPSVVYTNKFNRVFDELVQQYEGKPVGRVAAAAPTAASSSGAAAQLQPEKKSQQQAIKKPTKEDGDADADEEPASESTGAASSAAPVVNQSKLAALQQAARTGKPVHSFGKKKKKDEAPAASPTEPAKKGKVARTWDDNKATKAEARELDYARKIDGESAAQTESAESGFTQRTPLTERTDKYDGVEKLEYSDDDDDVTVEDDDDDSAAGSGKSGGGFFSFFKTLVAGKVLERSDLEPVMVTFKDNLTAKNVAVDISEQLAESVIQTLVGQKLASFTTVRSMVRTAVEAALTRILTPNRQIDVLAGIVEANEQKRPYSIVFVGVNGVGQCGGCDRVADDMTS